MTNKIEDFKDKLANLSETDKDAFKLSGRILAQGLLFGLTKVTVTHLVGRKIAPNVFKSWGRTLAVVYLIETATGRYSLSEADKNAIAAIKLRRTIENLKAGNE